MNLANKITIFRILLVPFFIALVLYARWEMALIVFVTAALSDALDGYIARTLKQKTELGKILDPIADKILILSAFICLSVVEQVPPGIKLPVYVSLVVFSREAIIILGALLIYIIKGKLEIKPILTSKITTVLQMITVIGVLLKLPASPILWNIAVAFTVYSGAEYIIKGSRILNEK